MRLQSLDLQESYDVYKDPKLVVKIKGFPSIVRRYIREDKIDSEKVKELLAVLSLDIDARKEYFIKKENSGLLGSLLPNYKIQHTFSDNGVIALVLGLLTIWQTFRVPVLISVNGISALLEGLITYEQAEEFGTYYDKSLSILLSENGLQALREKLITADQAFKIGGSSHYSKEQGLRELLSDLGLTALRESLITAEHAIRIRNLSLILCDKGLQALRDNLITADQATKIEDLHELLSDGGLQALEEGLITPQQAESFSYSYGRLKLLFTPLGLEALKNKMIVIDEIIKMHVDQALGFIKAKLFDLTLQKINSISDSLNFSKVVVWEELSLRQFIQLMEIIKVKGSQLKVLDVSNFPNFRSLYFQNSIHEVGKAIEFFVEVITGLNNLVVLNLSNNQLLQEHFTKLVIPPGQTKAAYQGFPVIPDLFSRLSKVKSLKVVDISNNSLSSISINMLKFIADNLLDISTLEVINVSYNGFNPQRPTSNFFNFVLTLSNGNFKLISEKFKGKVHLKNFLCGNLLSEFLDGFKKIQVLHHVFGMDVEFKADDLRNILIKLDSFGNVSSEGKISDVTFNREGICFFIFECCNNIHEIELAKDALLLIPENSQKFSEARSKIFELMYIAYRESGYDAKTSFMEAYHYCLKKVEGIDVLIELTKEVKDLFDAGLTEACGKVFRPGEKLTNQERVNRLFALRKEQEAKEESKITTAASTEEVKIGKTEEKTEETKPEVTALISMAKKSSTYPDIAFSSKGGMQGLREELRYKYIRSIDEQLAAIAQVAVSDFNLIEVNKPEEFQEKLGKATDLKEYEHYESLKTKINKKLQEFHEIINPLVIEKVPESVTKFYQHFTNIINGINVCIKNLGNNNYNDRFENYQQVIKEINKIDSFRDAMIKDLRVEKIGSESAPETITASLNL